MDKKKLTPEQQFYIDEQLYFTEELNNKSDEQIKEFHVEQKQNRDGILTEIAKVILSYSVIKEIMNIKGSDKKVLEANLINMVNEKVQAELNNETKFTGELLRSIGKEKYSVNNYIYSIGTEDKSPKSKMPDNQTAPKDKEKNIVSNVTQADNVKDKTLDNIINKKVEEKLWSDRLWDNKNKIAKDLRLEIKDFLNGKTTVNEIESKIKKKYNTNGYETKRLVQDNVARVQEGVNDAWREDHNTEYVLYMATLCSNTCANCRQYDGLSYEVIKKPVVLPQHCFCRCTYVNIPNPDWHPKMRLDNKTKKNVNWQSFKEWNANKVKPMNLNLFGLDNWKLLQQKIESGIINNDKFEMCYNEFNKMFKDGIKTPLENIKCNENTFVHIAQRHPDMVKVSEINNINKSLTNPKSIYEVKDKNGFVAKGYIGEINGNTLLVITRNDIMTSYYPSENYLRKNILGGNVLWENK